ncbi:MAG: helix-turn-helix transcriptional regulator [Oscillospiraceae bacterium]|nr:helix-turn-helix transcriptional regulator [Oscillospiraceae bacterium]MBR3474092.1 helix-turn-helix transcriptional regulator [Oscillospiraceae bacterium]
MKERKISEANFCDTGYSYTLSLIAGKYKPIVLYCLMEYEPVRFNEMRRYVGSAADKTLSQTLKELERDGLIHREMYPEIPPKVEYSLTERGQSLVRVLDQLCVWGEENRPKEPQTAAKEIRTGKE